MKKIKYILFAIVVLAIIYLKMFGLPDFKKDDKEEMELIASGGSTGRKPVEATIEDMPEYTTSEASEEVTDIYNIPEYDGHPYIVINDNKPRFKELTTKEYINLSELDSLGRCGPAEACLSTATMPSEGEQRGDIGNVKPSGWKQKKYEGVINSQPAYAVNRAHLIAWCLSSLNDST